MLTAQQDLDGSITYEIKIIFKLEQIRIKENCKLVLASTAV
mgnify:CR=1 FL=1